MISEFGYKDLETRFPPRNTSHHGIRIDYILCSPALVPRIDWNQTRLHLVDVGSDHQALVGNIRFNKNKLLIGIKLDPRKLLTTNEKQEIENGLNSLKRREILFTQEMDNIYQKLSEVDTVIFENQNVGLVNHSLDLCFELTKRYEGYRPSTMESKVFYVSSIVSMLEFIKAFLE